MTGGAAAVVGAVRYAACAVLDAVLPNNCAACHALTPAEAGPLCAVCAAEFDRYERLTWCRRCGRTMPALALRGRRCVECQTESFWNVAGIGRVGPYSGPLRQLILAVKHHGDGRATELLAERLSGALGATPWLGSVDVFIPVPMHALRRVQRPCHHARELALALARCVRRHTRRRIRVGRAIALRSRYGVSQSEVRSLADRFANVRDCFAVPRPADVAGKCVCIVDNVITSGATLHELSKTLRRAGARPIFAAVLARATGAGFQAPMHAALAASTPARSVSSATHPAES